MRDEFVSKEQRFRNTVPLKFLDDIDFLWIDSDGKVCRQSPRSSRPDGDACFSSQFAADDRKLNVNGCVIALLVLHFGFGERGLRAGAPKDRLLRLINETFLNENGERAQNFRFVFRIHRQIGIFPIAKDAQPFELLALDIDEFPRERFRSFADFERRKAPGFLHHFVFDRQTMTVPARDKRRAFAQHGLRFHHEIFENLI